MKPIKHLIRNTFIFRGERAYTLPDALEIMIRERHLKFDQQ